MEQIKDLKAFFISLTIIVSLALGIVWTKGTIAAAPKPSAADNRNLEDIKQNQRTKLQIEQWNASEVSALDKNGWTVQWSKDPNQIKLVPSFQ